MRFQKPLSDLVKSLSIERSICGSRSDALTVLGPNPIVIVSCGQIFDEAELVEKFAIKATDHLAKALEN